MFSALKPSHDSLATFGKLGMKAWLWLEEKPHGLYTGVVHWLSANRKYTIARVFVFIAVDLYTIVHV